MFKAVPAYAILDLFAGMTGEENVWELGFFAKNVTNKQVEISRVTPVNNVYGPYAGVSARLRPGAGHFAPRIRREPALRFRLALIQVLS